MKKAKKKILFLERRKKHKIRPWDVLVNIAAENLQDAFNETVDETVAEHQNKDIQEAEDMARNQTIFHSLYPAASIWLG